MLRRTLSRPALRLWNVTPLPIDELTAFTNGHGVTSKICTIVNDDQQDATILVYLFIPNQLYMFRGMSSPNIGST